MLNNEKLILVGVVSGAHGIKGHVTIRTFTEEPDNITKLLLQNSEGEKVTLKFSHYAKRDIVCMMSGVRDRTAAEKARGIKLYALRSEFPEIEEEEFYFADLIGLPVVNMQQEVIGKVGGVHNFGAGDIIEISAPEKKSELFPFTKELFPEITKDHVVMAEYKAIGEKEGE